MQVLGTGTPPAPGRVTAHARASRLIFHPCTFGIALTPNFSLNVAGVVWPSLQAPMLSCFPSLSENEFRDGCQALQRRCEGRLEDTDWLDIRWEEDVLTIKKSYHSGSSKDLQTDVKTHHPADLTSHLGDVDSEDEVLIWPICFTRR